jgi:hypothetical protein
MLTRCKIIVKFIFLPINFPMIPMLPRISLFLSIILILGSCCREKDLALSPALMAWAPYSGQQELTFMSPTGNKRTFVAGKAHFQQVGSDKACGSYAVETFQVKLRSVEDPGLTFQVTLSHEIVVRIKQLHTDSPVAGLAIDFNTISEHYISDPWRDRFYKKLVLNGKDYSNVLHAYGSGVAAGLFYREIYYGKGVGLIGFTLYSGESYFIQ